MPPKRRKTDKHLPARVYKNHGRYFFVDNNNKWHNLGKTPAEMAVAWAKLFTVSESNYITMTEVFDRYEAEVIPGKAEATQKTNHIEIGRLRGAFGMMSPIEIKPVDIYKYQDIRAKTAKTRANREKSLLSHVFSKAIEWGIVTTNPCKEVRRLREEPRDRLVTPEEYWAVHNLASPMLKSMMHFAFGTSLRRTDILNIKWADISDEGIMVPISKTKKRTKNKQLYKWDENLKEIVKSIPKRSLVYLFSNEKGQKYTDSGVNTLWHQLMKKAIAKGVIKETFQFRDIRAMSGTQANQMGGIEEARKRLGHATQAMTGTYIRSVTELYMLKPPPNKQK